jgi:hypothetical protein
MLRRSEIKGAEKNKNSWTGRILCPTALYEKIPKNHGRI